MIFLKNKTTLYMIFIFRFMAYEILRSGSEDLRIVISSENVRVFSCNPNSNGTTIIVERQLG